MDRYSPELQQRIRDLANWPMDKDEYAITAAPSTILPFVQLSVATQLGTFENTRFLALHCRSSPRQVIPIHDGLEIHGAITFGPRIRFYRLMANGIFGCCLWGGRDSLHVLQDHLLIAQHLEEIKSDWLSVYVPGR